MKGIITSNPPSKLARFDIVGPFFYRDPEGEDPKIVNKDGVPVPLRDLVPLLRVFLQHVRSKDKDVAHSMAAEDWEGAGITDSFYDEMWEKGFNQAWAEIDKLLAQEGIFRLLWATRQQYEMSIDYPDHLYPS